MKSPPRQRSGKQDHKLLALWAADCAQHVLPYFEDKYPDDLRPRQAIEAVRAWAQGEIRCGEARAAAWAAHAAARDTSDDAARAAARAAGHAAATAHVATHARGVAYYAVKAAAASGAARESEWHYRQLPLAVFPARVA